MSVVYLACAEGVHGVRALKVISPEHAARPGAAEMFVDEAQVVSRIRHPNVCSVLDYDVQDGDYYLAMEYLVGEPASSIRKRIERLERAEPDRLARRVARLIADVCEGLHAAHELTASDGEPMNVVHRDVSPENLFLTYEGVAKVVDFGLVCLTNQQHLTQTGVLKGKVAYIAPELLEGKRPDRRADVWGLGVVTWELLTGKRLFSRGTELDSLRAVVAAPIPRPSELRPGIPAALDDIVLRALERDPEKRYATAQQLGRDLLRIAASGADVVSTSDLAAWMSELFPGGRERRTGQIDLALQINAMAADRPPEVAQASNSTIPPPSPMAEQAAEHLSRALASSASHLEQGQGENRWPARCSGSIPPPTRDSEPSLQSDRPPGAASHPAATPMQVPPMPAPAEPAWKRSHIVAVSAALGLVLGVAGTVAARTLGLPEPIRAAAAATGETVHEPSPQAPTPALAPSPLPSPMLMSLPGATGGEERAGPLVVQGPVTIELEGTNDDLVLRIRRRDP